MRALKQILNSYIRQNMLLFVVLFVLYLAGVIFGSIGVAFLDAAQQKDIAFFVEKIFQNNTLTGNNQPFAPVILGNFKLFSIVWLLGLTIIGIPFIGVVVFTRGFALGFTSAFMVKLKGWVGGVSVALTLIPPNLLVIPLLLFAAVNSIIFSLYLLRGRQGKLDIRKNLIVYTVTMTIIASFCSIVGILQTYLAPLAVRTLSLLWGR